MLKKRIIPVQLLAGGRLVKTKRFTAPRDVGDPVASSKVYNDQSADELIILNIARGESSIAPLLNLIERISEVTFMPLAMGGGIRTVDDAERLIRNGCDKIILNSACYRQPGLIRSIAHSFGSQAIIVGVDVRFDGELGEYVCYSSCGEVRESISLKEHLGCIEEHGAGELFINSIDRDGMMTGYDTELARLVVNQTRLPVIACGGAGHVGHLQELFLETGVQAAACGSLFNFGDNNPIRVKAHLTNRGIPFKRI